MSEEPTDTSPTLTAVDKDRVSEIVRAKIRGALAYGYAYRLQCGMTVEEMAERAGWPVKQFMSSMNVHIGVSLSDLGVMAYALDLDIDIRLTEKPFVIVEEEEEEEVSNEPE